MEIYYEGEHIAKREVIDGVVNDIYITFKDGKIYLEKYIDFVIDSVTLIANLSNKS